MEAYISSVVVCIAVHRQRVAGFCNHAVALHGSFIRPSDDEKGGPDIVFSENTENFFVLRLGPSSKVRCISAVCLLRSFRCLWSGRRRRQCGAVTGGSCRRGRCSRKCPFPLLRRMALLFRKNSLFSVNPRRHFPAVNCLPEDPAPDVRNSFLLRLSFRRLRRCRRLRYLFRSWKKFRMGR